MIHDEILSNFLNLFQGIFCFLLMVLIIPDAIFFNQNLSKCNLLKLNLRNILNSCEISRIGYMILKMYSSYNIKMAFTVLNAIFIFFSICSSFAGIIK